MGDRAYLGRQGESTERLSALFMTHPDPTDYIAHVRACGAERIERLKKWPSP